MKLHPEICIPVSLWQTGKLGCLLLMYEIVKHMTTIPATVGRFTHEVATLQFHMLLDTHDS